MEESCDESWLMWSWVASRDGVSIFNAFWQSSTEEYRASAASSRRSAAIDTPPSCSVRSSLAIRCSLSALSRVTSRESSVFCAVLARDSEAACTFVTWGTRAAMVWSTRQVVRVSVNLLVRSSARFLAAASAILHTICFLSRNATALIAALTGTGVADDIWVMWKRMVVRCVSVNGCPS